MLPWSAPRDVDPAADSLGRSPPELDERFGDRFTEDLRRALPDLDGFDEEEAALLEEYGAEAIVPAGLADHERIEEIARELTLIR